MRSFLLGLSFSVVFVLGCGAGVVVRQQVAQAAPVAGKWHCFSPGQNGAPSVELTDIMNANASDVAQGNIFSYGGHTVCVKH